MDDKFMKVWEKYCEANPPTLIEQEDDFFSWDCLNPIYDEDGEIVI